MKAVHNHGTSSRSKFKINQPPRGAILTTMALAIDLKLTPMRTLTGQRKMLKSPTSMKSKSYPVKSHQVSQLRHPRN
jgi:hypothetical protein